MGSNSFISYFFYLNLLLLPIKQTHIMTDQSNPKPLHYLIRSQIIQPYPPQTNFIDHLKLDWDKMQDQKNDPLDLFMRENDMVEDYNDIEEKPQRTYFHGKESLCPENRSFHFNSRPSPLSCEKFSLQRDGSLEKLPNVIKKFSDDFMDEELQPPFQPLQKDKIEMEEQPLFSFNSSINQGIAQKPIDNSLFTVMRQKQKNEKITKLRQVGCNCKKSKCLKMYCQCFNLQIFCGENCNCVGCGNMEPNAGHQQAVIEALTRNPKAFNEEEPKAVGAFNLGVGLREVRKGCKCKKTKCLKKYCECFSSGMPCGMFCKCENCENGKEKDY